MPIQLVDNSILQEYPNITTVTYSNLPSASTNANKIVAVSDTNCLFYSDGKRWCPLDSVGDPTYGKSSTNPGISGWDIKSRNPESTDGIYWIKPVGYASAFQVYCDMTTDGGGWVLTDSQVNGESIGSRTSGGNTNPSVTAGRFLPAYTWSNKPQIMCKSTYFTGHTSWRSMNCLTAEARSYATQASAGLVGGVSGHFSYAIDNGNTQQGTAAWLWVGDGRTGTIWIGNGSQPSMAVAYAGNASGLGLYTYYSTNSSSWIR